MEKMQKGGEKRMARGSVGEEGDESRRHDLRGGGEENS